MENETTAATPVPSAEAQEGGQPYLEIIARLEAATEGSRELDAEIAAALGDMNDPAFHVDHYTRPPTYEVSHSDRGVLVAARVTVGDHSRIVCTRVPRHYTTSLDAALTLLPEGWWLQHLGHNLAGWGARVEMPGRSLPESTVLPRSPTPPLALCIACLRAKASPATVAADNGTPPKTDETKDGTKGGTP